MRTTDIDFMQRNPPRWLWLPAAMLAAASLVLLVSDARQRTQTDRIRAILGEVQASHATDVGSPAVTQPKPYQNSAGQLVRELRAPWPAALAALEGVSVEGVRIVAVDIAPLAGEVRLELQYEDMSQLLRLVEELNVGHEKQVWTLVHVASAAPPTRASAKLSGALIDLPPR